MYFAAKTPVEFGLVSHRSLPSFVDRYGRHRIISAYHLNV